MPVVVREVRTIDPFSNQGLLDFESRSVFTQPFSAFTVGGHDFVYFVPVGIRAVEMWK